MEHPRATLSLLLSRVLVLARAFLVSTRVLSARRFDSPALRRDFGVGGGGFQRSSQRVLLVLLHVDVRGVLEPVSPPNVRGEIANDDGRIPPGLRDAHGTHRADGRDARVVRDVQVAKQRDGVEVAPGVVLPPRRDDPLANAHGTRERTPIDVPGGGGGGRGRRGGGEGRRRGRRGGGEGGGGGGGAAARRRGARTAPTRGGADTARRRRRRSRGRSRDGPPGLSLLARARRRARGVRRRARRRTRARARETRRGKRARRTRTRRFARRARRGSRPRGRRRRRRRRGDSAGTGGRTPRPRQGPRASETRRGNARAPRGTRGTRGRRRANRSRACAGPRTRPDISSTGDAREGGEGGGREGRRGRERWPWTGAGWGRSGGSLGGVGGVGTFYAPFRQIFFSGYDD